MIKQQWFLIAPEKDHQKATQRFGEIKDAAKGSAAHKEKRLLACHINQYEEKLWDLPALDPIELIKVRMEDFGYTS